MEDEKEKKIKKRDQGVINIANCNTIEHQCNTRIIYRKPTIYNVICSSLLSIVYLQLRSSQ